MGPLGTTCSDSRDKDFSKLVSIMGVFACNLSVNELRNFCSNNGLGDGKYNKKSICDTMTTTKQFPPNLKEEEKFKRKSYMYKSQKKL